MGLQTAALNRFQAPGWQTTALTATITNLVRMGLLGLGLTKFAPGSGDEKSRTLFKFMVLACYGTGALLVGGSMLRLPIVAGLLPAVLGVVVVLRHRRRQ